MIQRAACLLAVVMLASCGEPMTKKLFFQSQRPQVLLPTEKEEQAGRMGQLSEIVTYQQKVDTLKRTNKALDSVQKGDDGIKTFSIKEVTITAERPRVKISTLRKGKVSLSDGPFSHGDER